MSFFGKNIRKIRNVKNMSQQAFADLFDLKRGTLGAYEEKRSEPKIETILKIANYFSITVDDLLTKELTVNHLLKFKGDLSLNTEEPVQEKLARIPLITEQHQKNYITNFENEYFIEELPCLHLPINTEKKFRGYTVINLEMTNHDQGLYPKDVVIGEFIPKEVYKKLENGCMVLALVNEELILRRLYITKNKITLRADHKSVEDKVFELTKIEELWKIRYVFYKRLPEVNPSQDLKEKFDLLEQEFLKIRKRL
jgi:transcriptional regulator with XRE-family HTH domain